MNENRCDCLVNISLIITSTLKILIAYHVKKKSCVWTYEQLHIDSRLPHKSIPCASTWLAKLNRSSTEALEDSTILPLVNKRCNLLKLFVWDRRELTGISKYRESLSCTWGCEMWFPNERNSSGMEEITTFVLAGAVTVASSLLS